MRTLRFVACCLVAALPRAAAAQSPTPAPAAAPQPSVAADAGRVDFGLRGTTFSGDGARYERYRDLGDGLFLERVRWTGERQGWFLDLSGDHVGRDDQRVTGSVVRPGRLKASLTWDRIPMLLSRTTRTLFDASSPAGTLVIDDALQAQVQADRTVLGNLFSSSSREFETESRRQLVEGSVEYLATAELTVRGTIRRTTRDGAIPYGGSFGHSSLVELPAPVEHALTDVDAGAEFERGRLLVRAGATGSWFHNDVTALAFDNPFRAVDIAGTPSRGRLSLPPSNSQVGVNAMASVRLPYRSRATGYVAIGSLEDNGDPLMAHTINTAIPTVPLPRDTVEGKARTHAVHLTFTSRPVRAADVTVRYRTFEYDNRTPAFETAQRVGYDNNVSTLAAPVHTEPFGIGRQTLDADLRVSLPVSGMTAGIGYSRLGEDRTHRIFESIDENQVRLTFDVIGRQLFTVRSKYEHGRKRGRGDAEEIAAELLAVNEQPGMRHFDIASRNRNRVTLIGTVTPTALVAVSGSVAVGKDDYVESLFGLRDNTHRVYGAGLDAMPSDAVTLGLSYAFERYAALSRSRQADNATHFIDPSRNWATDANDRVHSLIASAQVSGIADRIDVRVGYDFSRARATYNYITGPVPDRTLPEEVIVETTLPTPTALPPTLSELHRGTTDVTFALTERIGIGLSYWYERYRVADFTLDADANPDLARGQVLLMGYLYRPYTANTVWGRLIYRW
jgi:MtrB/PioB family decaheme-associated outer membrane protein